MKLPVSWLKDYVDFDDTPEGLAEKLTMSGTEVEAIETVGGDFEGIVVGEVLKVDKHPNADKLTLCTVNTGSGEMTVVCGAPNAKPGLKVPFAPSGVTLPNGLKLILARRDARDIRAIVVRFMKSSTDRPDENLADRAVGSTWFGPPT